MKKRYLIALSLMASLLQSGVGRPEVVQVTEVPPGRGVSQPSVDATGRWIAFSSTANLGGLNPTPVNNVFVFDAVAGIFERITSEGGNDAVISPDGRFLAFSSDANYTRRNEDGSEEIFRYDRQRRRFYQVTRDNLGVDRACSRRSATRETASLTRRRATCGAGIPI